VLEEYNTSTNAWESVVPEVPLLSTRPALSPQRPAGGSGSRDDDGNHLDGAVLEEYNPSTSTWESEIPVRQGQDDPRTEKKYFVAALLAKLEVENRKEGRKWWFKPLSGLDPIFKFLAEDFCNSFRSHRARRGSEQWCDVAAIQITSIELVASPDLQEGYARMLDIQRQDASRVERLAVEATPLDATLNEFLLYHGTTNEAVDKICAEGFDPLVRREASRPIFGSGTYFASAASKADKYTSSSRAAEARGLPGLRRQIVTRVCLGHAYLTRRSMRDQVHPPLYADAAGTRMYDSVLGLTRAEGGTLDFREYVVYDRDRCLPAAVITYMHTPGCRCHVCRGGM
jgi:hypothetical protein